MKTNVLISVVIFLLYTHPALAEIENLESKAVKSFLSATHVATAPGGSKVTRSLFGPSLYRSNVSSAVLIVVLETGADGKPQPAGQGSGVVLSQGGLILTNWHVAWSQAYVVVVLYPGANHEPEEKDFYYGKVVRLDQTRDLALIQMVAGKDRTLPQLKPITLEKPEVIEIGQDVFAIGHPIGLTWTYTEGVISQIRPRYIWEMEGRKFRATVIQTQTSMNHGSSGGPLINRDGRLVGIVSNMVGDRGGLNFAISVQEILSFLAGAI
jgi:S1-C subfamily serine protease